MTGKIQFTIVYDWLARRRDLSWPEKMVIAHILRYDKNEYGCFKSNGNIAKALGFSKHHGRVTVIRIINRLEYLDWVIKRTYPARERSLFINRDKLDDMPLLAGVKGRGKPVSKPVKSCGKPVSFGPEGSGSEPPGSGSAPLGGSGAAPPGLNRNSKESFLRDIEETKEKDFSSSVLDERKKKKGKPTAREFEDRRRRLIEQIEGIK